MSLLSADGLSQKERMCSGRLHYGARDPQLLAERQACRKLCYEFNTTPVYEDEKRRSIMRMMFRSVDEDHPPLIESPFICDYGYNIALGKDVYMNFGCILLDSNDIIIGDNALIGPNVQFYPPGHPIDGQVRDGIRGPMYAHPIKIGNDCWIGGSAIICGGVTVGNNCVIGAGAVVTKNVPDWCVAAGNPAQIVRQLKQGDKNLSKEIP